MRTRSTVLLFVVAILCACSRGPEQRPLTVVGWGGTSQAAHRNAYWLAYEKGTGVPIREDVWHGGIGVLRAKVMGGDPGWDVVQAEVEEVILGCEEGVLEPLDWPALGGRDAFFAPAVHDCGVGAMVWSYLLAYDGDRLDDDPQSWADFWNVARFPGKRGMRKTPKYTLEIALLADGVAPADVYRLLRTPEGLARAFAKLDTLRPHIVWWSSISQVPDLIHSGEVAMSVASPGRLLLVNQTEGKNFKVVWNQNIYAVDFWVVLKNSPRRKEAMDLVRFMTRPGNQSRLPTLIPTGPSHKQAIAAMSAQDRARTPLAPENIRNALALDAEFWVEHLDPLTQRFNAWAARGQDG